MPNDYTLIILSPMQEEYAVLRRILEDEGYTAEDMFQLAHDKKLFLCETGMGALNMLHTIYTAPHFFEKKKIDVLLTGFAGALSPSLHKGDACQISRVSHFTFMEFQGGGDFEWIPTPALYHQNFLSAETDSSFSLPHVRLAPTDVGAQKTYNLISVPALLQGTPTKKYLYGKGAQVVDMEGFALASALHHVAWTQDLSLGSTGAHKSIGLDVVKVITDCPDEPFDFSKLEEYKEHLQQCELLRTVLKSKLAQF